VIDTNLSGTFNMMQRAARHWARHRLAGSIVTIVVSPAVLLKVAHTCAPARGSLHSRGRRGRMGALRIRVNAIAPGAIVSEGWAVYAKRYASAIRKRVRCAAPYALGNRRGSTVCRGPGSGSITDNAASQRRRKSLGEVWTAASPPTSSRHPASARTDGP